MNHEFFMQRCLDLAFLGRGKVGNGAIVGAILVREGEIVAEGYHAGFGMPHAEQECVKNFDQEIQQKDRLYVNLEPCTHHGKTPPCVDAILERGIRSVVYGMEDPDSRVAGEGIKRLRAFGAEVIGPVSRALCERSNRGFVSARERHRPWITLKCAQTRERLVAKPDGSPLKITSPLQDAWSHAVLRGGHHAILVGVGTVILDNPELNIRETFIKRKNMNRNNDQYQPLRIILDPHLRIPLTARVVSDSLRSNTIIVQSEQEASEEICRKERALKTRGVRMFPVPANDQGIFVWNELWKKLLTPCDDWHGLTSILVEGGTKTWKAFRDAGCIDEEIILVGS